MLAVRRAAARRGAEWRRARGVQAPQARGISSAMRAEEHRAMQAERLVMLGADAPNERPSPSGMRSVQDVLASGPLDEVRAQDLFRASNIAEQLEAGDEGLMKLVASRVPSKKDVCSDRWCASFILSMYHTCKRLELAVMPAKVTVQAVKYFLKKEAHGGAFNVGAETLNATLASMYSEKVDVDALYKFYGRYKQFGVPPNQNTVAMMFNVSLRGQKMKNAENFFAACEKLLLRGEMSYTPKSDIINSLALGLSDCHNAEYTLRLIKLLEKACFDCAIIPTLPRAFEGRKTEHLYVDPTIAEKLIWAAMRTRNPDLHAACVKWLEFFEAQGKPLGIQSHIFIMRICAANSEHVQAFEMWDKICETFEDRVMQAYSVPVRSACIFVLECATRSRRDQNLERSRAMMTALIDKGILSSDRDKAELYMMQIRLLAGSNDYKKAQELYMEVKKDCRADPRLVMMMLRSPFAKDNLDILKVVYEDWMEETKKPANDITPEKVSEIQDRYIGVLAQCGELGEVLQILDALTGTASKITLNSIERVLQACARDKEATSYGTFYKWTEGGQDDMPLFFSHLKNNRTTIKNCEVARGVFDKLPELGLEPTTKTYNHLMSVYSSAKDHDEVSRLYNIIKEDPKLVPTHETYYHMAKAFAERGSVDMVETIMGELIGEIKKSGKQEEGEGDAKKEKKVTLSSDLAAQAIRALANTGMRIETVAYMRNMTPGEEELDWMDEQNSKIIPTRQPRQVEVDMGFKIIDGLKMVGINVNQRAWSALLNLCTRAQDTKKAKMVYDMIKEDKRISFTDRSDVVTNLMKMYYTQGHMEAALHLLDEVRVADTFALDPTAYHNCIAVCANQGNIEGCKVVLTAMFEDDHVRVSDTAIAMTLVACAYHKPDVTDDDYDMVLKAKSVFNEYRDMHKLHREKVPVVNSQHMFHKMLFVCAMAKNSSEARLLIEEMKDYQVAVDKTTMQYLARSLRSCDQIPDFWQQMERERVDADTAVIFRLLQICRAGRDAMAALEIVTKYPQLCNEKLQIMFYQIVESAKLPEAELKKYNEKFFETFGRDLKEVGQLVKGRAKELTQESSQRAPDSTQITSDTDDIEALFDEGDDGDDDTTLNY